MHIIIGQYSIKHTLGRLSNRKMSVARFRLPVIAIQSIFVTENFTESIYGQAASNFIGGRMASESKKFLNSQGTLSTRRTQIWSNLDMEAIADFVLQEARIASSWTRIAENNPGKFLSPTLQKTKIALRIKYRVEKEEKTHIRQIHKDSMTAFQDNSTKPRTGPLFWSFTWPLSTSSFIELPFIKFIPVGIICTEWSYVKLWIE